MSDSSPPISVCCSAPGKVLLAGGYLVLDRAYSGLVIGLDARIYAVARNRGKRPKLVSVRSPQFKEAEWEYEVKDSWNPVAESSNSSANPFVETTLRYVLAYLFRNDIISSAPDVSNGISVTILADNDYYSQPSDDVPRFNDLGVKISDAHKTGLGSSAALTTSLTAALLSLWIPSLDLSTQSAKNLVHKLAQAAHCAAQGKVGSGFDVAAAVYGSCVYRRFSPNILEAVGDPSSPDFHDHLLHCAEKADWDHEVTKTGVPKGLRLVMGDVDCGSSTPGMVKKVLAWRTANPQDRTWDVLLGYKDGLAELFSKLLNEERAPTHLETRAIADIILAIRREIRFMGTESGVPIEPEEQTALLDAALQANPDVVGGVVPGAGGYDAVAFLVRDLDESVEGLKKWLGGYKFGQEGGKVVALGTREEYEGVRRESVEEVERDGPK